MENTEDVVEITQETTEKKEKEKLEKENTDELKTEEIGEAIMKIKINKAAGINEIQIEAWRYGGDKIKKGKSWKEDLVGGTNSRGLEVEHYSVFIQKKEIKKRLKIIGISLLCSAYKIYTEILRNRLEVEVKKKEIIPVSQAGFRKEKFTLDNIFVLNHIIQRKRVDKKESQKIYAIFIDLKSVFDNINRGKL